MRRRGVARVLSERTSIRASTSSLRKPGLELLEGRADVGGRQLLGQQLEEEFHQAPSFPPVYRRAMSLTRARIWEIILTRSVTLMAPRESSRLKLWEHFRHMS